MIYLTYHIGKVTWLLWQPEYNSFALSCIEFMFDMGFLGMLGISHVPRCCGNSVTMATRVKCQ